jgi:hypothetical protein
MSFDPCNCTMKIRESIWDSNSEHGSSLGSVRVHSFTLFALPGACDVTPRSFSWPATLQPLTLVASPRLKLQHLRPSIWIQWPIDMGKRIVAKENLKGTCERLIHGCRIVISNLITKGTSWLLRKQETSVLQCHHLNLINICLYLHMPYGR